MTSKKGFNLTDELWEQLKFYHSRTNPISCSCTSVQHCWTQELLIKYARKKRWKAYLESPLKPTWAERTIAE